MGKAKINKLFEHRTKVRYCEKQLGLTDLSDNVKATLEFIASRSGTRIKDICDESYFDTHSLSTIKRNITILKERKLIKIKEHLKNDNRRNRVLVLT
jgi:DNA-binding MarR family transcriptional regulator